MKHTPGPLTPALPDAAVPVDELSEIEDEAPDRVVARPDGYHWVSADGRQEFGPFETYEDAQADMLAADGDDAASPGEALQEAEDEIGIADWIDPDTGEPAEGQSPPHLEVD